MADKLDEKRIERVQKLIGADDEEMKKLIQQARETPTLKSRQRPDGGSDSGSVAQIVRPPSPPPASPEPKNIRRTKRSRK
jgi:hypothetical protein